jgi:hypothetical protein
LENNSKVEVGNNGGDNGADGNPLAASNWLVHVQK